MTLIRHGQTACSQADVYCGRHCDPSLTAEGRATAEQLARKLQSTRWDALYASPLVRAQQTILPLAQALGVEPQLVAALAELDYGDWDGQKKADLLQRVPEAFTAWLHAPSRHAPPGGETAQMLWRRTRRALMAIVHAHTPAATPTADGHIEPVRRVVVVSHKSTLRVALCGLLGLDLDRFRERFAWPLGAMAQIDFTPAGPHLVRLGDTEYTSPAAPDAQSAAQGHA